MQKDKPFDFLHFKYSSRVFMMCTAWLVRVHDSRMDPRAVDNYNAIDDM